MNSRSAFQGAGGRGNPPASSPAALNRMRAAKPADTTPEIALRSALHRRGLRFRTHVRPCPMLNRSADIVFRSARVAVFVDGCFWHGCPYHGTTSKANKQFWQAKIKQNRARDLDTNRRLKAEGWKVVRVWEHQDPGTAAEHIRRIVNSRA